MRIIKATLAFAIGLFLVKSVAGQQVPLFNQYMKMKGLAYPSASVYNERPLLSLVYREQFSGLEGGPTAMGVAYMSKWRERMGVNFNVINAEVGLLKQLRAQAGFGYKVFNKGGHAFSLGTMLGFSSFSLNEDVLSPESLNDPVIVNLLGNTGSAFSVDVSLSYRYKNFRLDAAAPVIVNESLTDDQYVQINDDNVPDYIAGVAYEFVIDEVAGISVIPNVTWRYREVLGSDVDMVARVNYKDKFGLIGGYRGNYGGTVGATYRLAKNIEFSYNYDFGKSEVPFLADGFSEFALHFDLKTREELKEKKYKEGAAVYQQVLDENIYDDNLLNPRQQRMLKEYFYSLEQGGSRKAKWDRAEERYTNFFGDLKEAETQKLEARLNAEKQAKQDSINAVQAEQARLAAERQRQQRLEEQREAEARAEAQKAAEKEQAEAEQETTQVTEYERATNSAIEKLSNVEQARVRRINELVTPDRLTELGSPGDADYAKSMKSAYIIVVASYKLDSRYSRVFLNSIVDEYDDARIFASRKRKLDYVYIGQSDDYEAVLERMQKIRQDTRFKNAWVHIVRLSELNN